MLSMYRLDPHDLSTLGPVSGVWLPQGCGTGVGVRVQHVLCRVAEEHQTVVGLTLH